MHSNTHLWSQALVVTEIIKQKQLKLISYMFLHAKVTQHNFLRFQVRDGSASTSPLLGTFCGDVIPPRLQSTQRSMYIRFKTDSSVSNHGFEAAYGSALEGENSISI